jgi:putative FmdB family regulatory protein
MPIFEFVCSQCGKPFEELVRFSSAASEVTCPACGSLEVKKQISVFASKVSGGGSFGSLNLGSGAGSASCSTGST